MIRVGDYVRVKTGDSGWSEEAYQVLESFPNICLIRVPEYDVWFSTDNVKMSETELNEVQVLHVLSKHLKIDPNLYRLALNYSHSAQRYDSPAHFTIKIEEK